MDSLEKNINKEIEREKKEDQEEKKEDQEEKKENESQIYYSIYHLQNQSNEIKEKIKSESNKFEEKIKSESNKFEEKIKSESNKFEEKIKEIQKQYITILGIFASIVLTFTGSFAFSSSILSHMHQVSIYRLIFVILCIALFIVNILHGLYNFLIKIHNNGIEVNHKKIIAFNIVILLLIIANYICYYMQIGSFNNILKVKIAF
ncbi:hypothetical protein H2279_07755 [Campylobacter sp. B0100352/1]|uniref:hypothetical protein n=1 Tax=Campylobacter sp. B0100352/1 TaxID=2735783 RepID=UPI001DA73733|nr:hypothetical protein [Campylobacter sp. B0100352/1]